MRNKRGEKRNGKIGKEERKKKGGKKGEEETKNQIKSDKMK